MQSHWKNKGMQFFSWLISLNVILGCGLDNICKSMYYLLPSYLTKISSDRNTTSHYRWDYNRDIMQLGTYLLIKCGNTFKEHLKIHFTTHFKYLHSDNLFYMEQKWNVKNHT